MISRSHRFRTDRPVQALDLTEVVSRLADDPGLYMASCPHTTAALVLSESDEDLLLDFEGVVARVTAALGLLRHHKNDNPNGAAHIMSGIFGSQVFVPISTSGVSLGQYQRLVFLEMDGPRERTIELTRLALPQKGGE